MMQQRTYEALVALAMVAGAALIGYLSHHGGRIGTDLVQHDS